MEVKLAVDPAPEEGDGRLRREQYRRGVGMKGVGAEGVGGGEDLAERVYEGIFGWRIPDPRSRQ